MPPLWDPQHPRSEDEGIEIGFRDLVELRFVKAFIEAGIGLKTIRSCLAYARVLVSDARPFTTQRFRTDGRTIFLQSIEHPVQSSPTPPAEREQLLDLRKRQFVFTNVIDRTFRDLDIEDDVVARWRPLRGKSSIVLDPTRAFGQPIAAAAGVPTVVLADAVEAEGSVERAAALYEVEVDVVKDALRFEAFLKAA